MLESNLVNKIARNKFFRNIDKAAIERLDKANFVEMKFDAGATIIKQDTIAEEMYLIISGTVKIIFKLQDGNHIEIIQRHNDDFIGEQSLIDDQPRSATVQCVTEVELIAIKIEAFYSILGNLPQLSSNVAKTMANRLRESDSRVTIEIEKYKLLFNLYKQIKALNEKLKRKNEELYEQSIHDGLLKIYNRTFVMESFAKEYSRSKRHKECLACIIIDFDHFKLINDTFGHLVGDNVLKKSIKLISKNIRKEDIFGRFGGEEFLLILPKTTTKDAELLANKLREKVAEQEFSSQGKDFSVTVSLGIADNSISNFDSIDDIIRNADIALYKAKEKGRNQIVVFKL